MHGHRRLLACLLLLLVSPVLAQEPADPVIISHLDETLGVKGGETEAFVFTVAADNAHQDYLVRVDLVLPKGANWEATVSPLSTTLAPGSERTFTVTVTAARNPAPREMDVQVVVSAVGEDFQTFETTVGHTVLATGTTSVLGRWDNPLPAPLDGASGAFVLNIVAWLIISQVALWLIRPVLKGMTKNTKTELDDRIVGIIGRPVFILLFTYGVVQSLEVFAFPAWVFTFMDRTWKLVFSVVVVYVIYKLWKAVILTIGRRVSRRTESELDDRLYPVFEKVGGIIILIIGGYYVMTSVGVDVTLFAAGGAVASLVIAFAAQDTLANFFAGIFILLDRPFRVGDRIELPEQEHWGDVVSIGLRSTAVRTQDNRMVIFPNNVIGTNPVINHSYPDPLYRIQVEFDIPYGSDIEYVRKTLVEAVEPLEGVNRGKPVEALLLEFNERGQGWRLRWWIDSYVDTRRMFDKVNSAVIKQLGPAGIRIPHPTLVLWDAEKLAARPSGGGLVHKQLTDAERTRLEQKTAHKRRAADAQDAAEVEEMRRKAKEESEKRLEDMEKRAGDGEEE